MAFGGQRPLLIHLDVSYELQFSWRGGIKIRDAAESRPADPVTDQNPS